MPNWVRNRLDCMATPPDVFNQFVEDMKSDDSKFDFNKLIPEPKPKKDRTRGLYPNEGLLEYKSVLFRIANPRYARNGGKRGYYSLSRAVYRWLGVLALSICPKYPDKIPDYLKYLKDSQYVVSRLIPKNYLIKRGNRYDVRQLRRYLKHRDGKELLRVGRNGFLNLMRYGCLDWYDWRLCNWGTKWNAADVEICPDEQMILFNTAWSAPEPIMDAMADKYPELDIVWTYADESPNFVGCSVIKGGLATESDTDQNDVSEMYEYCWGVPYECCDEDDVDYDEKDQYYDEEDDGEDEEDDEGEA